jgi:hypothetical protein
MQNLIKSARADRRHFDATTIGHRCNEAGISRQNIILPRIRRNFCNDWLRERKSPAPCFQSTGHKFWQRPTLAQPRDALPSGLQRFTSVFGMGTGGATAL